MNWEKHNTTRQQEHEKRLNGPKRILKQHYGINVLVEARTNMNEAAKTTKKVAKYYIRDV